MREETFVGIFMETLPALLVSGLFAMIPGFFLTIYANDLAVISGLLTLIPAIIGMRGNVFGSFCAHMSSLHHLKSSIISDHHEEIQPEEATILRGYEKEITARRTAAMAEVLILSILLPFLSFIVFYMLNKPIASLELLLFICMSSGLTSGILLMVVSLVTIQLIREHGLDPDNIAPPLVTTLGDVVTLPVISFCAYIGLSLKSVSLWSGNVLGTVLMVYFLHKTYLQHPIIFRTTIIQRIPILLCCLILSSLAGLAMEEYLTKISSSFLFFVPLINAQGGNCGSIFASRISSAITLEVNDVVDDERSLKNTTKVVLSKERLVEVGSVVLSMICVFLFIGVIVNILGTNHTWLILLLFFILAFLLGASSELAAMSVTLLAVGVNVNPDNIVIACVCAFMDLFGTYCYALLLLAFHLL